MFIVLYLTERGYSAGAAGLVLGVSGLGNVLGNALGGYLADKIGRCGPWSARPGCWLPSSTCHAAGRRPQSPNRIPDLGRNDGRRPLMVRSG